MTHEIKNNTGKTIFLTVSKGTIAKNILRSGTLDELTRRGFTIILFFESVRDIPMPSYLTQEFAGPQVIIEEIRPVPRGFWHRRFTRLTSVFVYNKVTRLFRYVRYGWPMYRYYIERVVLPVVSKIDILKRAARFIEKNFFYYGTYEAYFDRYQPSVVFTTSIIGGSDIEMMKEAQRRGIPTVSMPRGWDNINTILYEFVPDRLLLQGDIMKEGAKKYQGIDPEKVSIIGFPQFDLYRKPEILISREEYCTRYGLDPKLKIILWASSWAPKDQGAAQTMIEALKTPGALDEKANLVIRSHFLNPDNHSLGDSGSHIAMDRGFTPSDYFRDNCDPTIADMVGLANTLYHADLVITQCSTIVLDAFCYDKPVINIVFKSFYDKNGKDISRLLYNHDYYMYILDSGATDLAHSEQELVEKINQNLKHPEARASGRAEVIRALAHAIDGKSSERVADVIASLA